MTTVALTGTALAGGLVCYDFVGTSRTVIITLTGNTWVDAGAPFDGVRQSIIYSLTSNYTGFRGWNNKVKPSIPVENVIRTSATIVTVTIPMITVRYGIPVAPGEETITFTLPDSAVSTPPVSPPIVAPEAIVIGRGFVVASGGTETLIGGDYRLHTFFSSGTFTVSYTPPDPMNFEYTVVGGGGSGGATTTQGAGGGGAGATTHVIAPGHEEWGRIYVGAHSIVVGAGAAGVISTAVGLRGNDSELGSLSLGAGGGGGGLGGASSEPRATGGGSGGGTVTGANTQNS